MTSRPARLWSTIATVTASRVASSRSSGPSSSRCAAASSSHPGNGWLPTTVVRIGSCGTRASLRLLRPRLDSYTVGAMAGPFDVSGRRVVVTGASSGIGASVASAFAAAGARVAGISLDGGAPVDGIFVAGDTGDVDAVEGLARRVEETWGG